MASPADIEEDDEPATKKDVKPMRALTFNIAGAPTKRVFKAIRDHAPAEELRDLLKAAPLDGRDGDGLSYLHVAVLSRNLRALAILINAGCDMHARFENVTPLMLGISQYQLQDTAVMLAKADPDLTKHTLDGVTALHLAAGSYNCDRVVEVLLERGHAPAPEDKDGRTPLYYALKQKEEIAITICAAGGYRKKDRAKLDEAIANQEKKYGFDYDWAYLLDMAAKQDSRKLAKDLDKKDPQMPRELSPEEEAFFKDVRTHGSSFRFEKCYDDLSWKDYRDHENMNPLMAGIESKLSSDMWAVRNLAWRADPETVDDAGRTVLHYCVQHTDQPAASIYDRMAGEADIDAQDNFGRTPLMITMRGGNFLSELMESGANPHIRDRLGLTAMDYCRFYKSKYCQEELKEEMEKHGWEEETPASAPFKRHKPRGFGL
jgi:ankyrin repeat protein